METDYESGLDEIERRNLQKAISTVETALAVSTPGTRPIFETFLQNAKGRVDALDKKIKDSQLERESRSREQVVLMQMAERESKLNSEEKKAFSGFLQKDYFTKRDFGSLEAFYSKTWNRLSDEGKSAMSHRVWEGIRRDEYSFTELPRTVREKETEQAYNLMRHSEIEGRNTLSIPKSDRADFIRTYETGSLEEAGKILERKSFKENLFRSSQSKAVKQTRVEIGREVEGDNVERIASVATAEAGDSGQAKLGDKSAIDLSDFNLEGVKLAEAPDKISSIEIKAATAPAAQGGPSLRRG